MQSFIARLLSAGTLFLYDGPSDTGGGGGGGGDKQPVPYERFADVNTKLAEEKSKTSTLEARVAELEGNVNTEKTRADTAEQKLAEKEREKLPEKERLERERDEAKAAAEAADARATKAEEDRVAAERTSWIRAAAAKANFHDPEDAVLRIDASKIRTQEGAEREVEAIATADATKHLVKSEEKPPAAGAGDLLKQVLEGGERVGDGKNGDGGGEKPVIEAAKFNALSQDELVTLQERDPALYQRSLVAAAESGDD